MEALGMMAFGDSALFRINADSFFLKTKYLTETPSYVGKGSKLTFLIKLDSRMTPMELDSALNAEKLARMEKENLEISEYISKNGLDMKPTENGVRSTFYQHTEGTPIVDGAKVRFHFIGRLLNGIEFINTYTMGSPVVVIVGREDIDPPYMNELLKQMREGEKASFLLPYAYGFGEGGIKDLVPPFSTLLYEINILKVE
jgi:FKBP-type peptidyl-prolyl cis-trans isomerase